MRLAASGPSFSPVVVTSPEATSTTNSERAFRSSHRQPPHAPSRAGSGSSPLEAEQPITSSQRSSLEPSSSRAARANSRPANDT